MAARHGPLQKQGNLAVAGYRAKLAGQEVVGRPWTADGHFAILKLLGCRAVPILILFHALGVDQVGDIDQHALGRDLLAADFFFQWIEQLMDLDRESPSFRLTLAFSRRLHFELGQIIAANGVGKFDVDHRFAQGTIADDQLDVHFGLAAQLRDTQAKSAPVDPDGLAKCVIAIEDCAEFEGQDGGIAEAVADDSRMLNRGFMVEFAGCVVVFADYYGEFTTGIAQNSSSVDPLNSLKKKRTSGAGAIWEGLVLGKTVRVPRHVELSEPGWRRTKPSLTSSYFAKACELRVWK